jgi:ABC-type Na+ efflux pump permease subunit
MQSDQRLQKIMATIGPLMISCLLIFTLLTLESLALQYIPFLSPLIMYITSTAGVLYCFYATPWLTFKFLEREKFYLKSVREQVYMNRLVL